MVKKKRTVEVPEDGRIVVDPAPEKRRPHSLCVIPIASATTAMMAWNRFELVEAEVVLMNLGTG